MTSPREYLVAVGAAGTLGRFIAMPSLRVQRSDEVIVKTDRGLERGAVLRPVESDQVILPYRPPPGELVRHFTLADRHHFASLAVEQSTILCEARRPAD